MAAKSISVESLPKMVNQVHLHGHHESMVNMGETPFEMGHKKNGSQSLDKSSLYTLGVGAKKHKKSKDSKMLRTSTIDAGNYTIDIIKKGLNSK